MQADSIKITDETPHPYCPDEDGQCQYGRDENCPGIARVSWMTQPETPEAALSVLDRTIPWRGIS